MEILLKIDLDFENLCTSFHYDEVFGTIINRFCAQSVANFPLTVYGTGNQKRGYINIIDTINCINLAISILQKERIRFLINSQTLKA